MQCLARSAQKASVAKAAPASRRSVTVVRGAVKCQASMQQAAKKAAAAVASVPALLAASPAFALVDDRLNGDGTGLPVGVNDPALTTAILGAFFLVWVLWYNSQKDLGDDAGLDL